MEVDGSETHGVEVYGAKDFRGKPWIGVNCDDALHGAVIGHTRLCSIWW